MSDKVDKRILKLERDDALRQVASVAPLLSLTAQATLNEKLKELVGLILAMRAGEEKQR